MARKVTICIMGGGGAGKTTFLNFIRSHALEFAHNLNFCDEPIDDWRDVGGENLYDIYHKDRNRWSFAFQSKAVTSNAKLYKAQEGITIIERSIYSATEIYAPVLCEQGYLSKTEFEILKELADILPKTCFPDAVIYINTDLERTLQRIRERDRKEERGKHDIYFRTRSIEKLTEWMSSTKLPTLTINGNEDFRNPTILRKFDDFVQKLVRE